MDFEAAYDGPVLNASGEVPMQVDDLIICENCIRGAARLVDMIEASDDAAASKIERLERELARERTERIDATQRLQSIKALTAESLSAVEMPVSLQIPKPAAKKAAAKQKATA